MNDFVIYLAITSLWIFGVYAVFESRHIFGKVGAWIVYRTSEKFCRPFFLCPVCMSSFWGLVIGLKMYGVSIIIIPFIICLAGLNFIVNSLLPEYD